MIHRDLNLYPRRANYLYGTSPLCFVRVFMYWEARYWHPYFVGGETEVGGWVRLKKGAQDESRSTWFKLQSARFQSQCFFSYTAQTRGPPDASLEFCDWDQDFFLFWLFGFYLYKMRKMLIALQTQKTAAPPSGRLVNVLTTSSQVGKRTSKT